MNQEMEEAEKIQNDVGKIADSSSNEKPGEVIETDETFGTATDDKERGKDPNASSETDDLENTNIIHQTDNLDEPKVGVLDQEMEEAEKIQNDVGKISNSSSDEKTEETIQTGETVGTAIDGTQKDGDPNARNQTDDLDDPNVSNQTDNLDDPNVSNQTDNLDDPNVSNQTDDLDDTVGVPDQEMEEPKEIQNDVGKIAEDSSGKYPEVKKDLVGSEQDEELTEIAKERRLLENERRCLEEERKRLEEERSTFVDIMSRYLEKERKKLEDQRRRFEEERVKLEEVERLLEEVRKRLEERRKRLEEKGIHEH